MVLQAGDIVLVVVSVVFFIILIVGCVYFLVYFQHPDDKLVAWFPKIVVVTGLVVSCTNVLLLPLDVATQGSDVVARGLFPMQQMEYAFFLISVILFFAVIPFTYVYYESFDYDELKQTVKRQIFEAIKWVFPFLLIIAAIMTAVYWYEGFAELPLKVYQANLRNTSDIFTSMCASTADGCNACAKTISFRVSPMVLIIAIVNILGFVVLVTFGGVGLIALPLDFILEFKNRPRSIKLQEYSRRKLIIGQRAEALMKEGQKIQKAREEALKLTSGKRKAMRAVEKSQKEFKPSLLFLERDYRDLNEAYQNQGGNIILQWAKFLFAVLGVVISFFWILHIAIYILPQVFNQAPLTPLLNDFFEEVSKAPIFGPLFYGLFAFYLLMCVVKGNIKLGFRFVFFTLYPLRLHDTMMNALLFNTGLIVCGSLAVVQLCTIAFSQYARFTSINGLFFVQITNLRGIRYIFNIYSFAILGFALVTLIYLLIKPYDMKQSKLLDRREYDNKGKSKSKKGKEKQEKEEIALKAKERDWEIQEIEKKEREEKERDEVV